MTRDRVEMDEARHDRGDDDEAERTKAIQHYFDEYLKDPCIIWESISAAACSSDEEAAKRVREIACAIKLLELRTQWGQSDLFHLNKLVGLVTAAFNYIMDLSTERYDTEGVPDELQQ